VRLLTLPCASATRSVPAGGCRASVAARQRPHIGTPATSSVSATSAGTKPARYCARRTLGQDPARSTLGQDPARSTLGQDPDNHHIEQHEDRRHAVDAGHLRDLHQVVVAVLRVAERGPTESR